MAKKDKTQFLCSECGATHQRWLGQCSCGQWNTLVEFKEAKIVTQRTPHNKAHKGYSKLDAKIEKLSEVSDMNLIRFDTGSAEFNRVLGGGIVEASVVLVAGDPGAGKSTLLIKTCSSLSQQGKALYTSGEESKSQVRDRGLRLQLNIDNIDIMNSGDIELICDVIVEEKYKFVVIDSIQTAFVSSLPNAPGGVTQVKESAAMLNRLAKEHGVTVLLVCHVAKSGDMAGPKVLEHIGDSMCKLECEVDSKYRTLRASKNRFGDTSEVGTFAMTSLGMQDITNPSAIFLEKGSIESSGNMTYASNDGGRTLLINIQALVTPTHGEIPERGVVGIDYKRVSMLLAILRNRMGENIGGNDIYANVVSGVNLSKEVGADLPLVLAMISSHRNAVFPSNTIAFGEIGLSGEIRPVPSGEERVKEAIRNDFKTIILPKRNYHPRMRVEGVTIMPVSSVSELHQVFELAKN
ncbi:MAG: DNA repair protein RadA [Thalassotalea sp.]